jgi:hypothetical protein
MDRRLFLKLTGLAAATAGALEIVPTAVRPNLERPATESTLQAPGLYQITGRVRLDEPLVEITGITNAQQITWSGQGTAVPHVAGFSSFEQFDRPWQMPDIHVRGGTLESMSVVPINIA